MTISVLFTTFGGRKIIKLLELYDLVLMLRMWQLKNQKVAKGSAKIPPQKRCSLLNLL